MKLVYLYVEYPVEGLANRNLNFSTRYEICLDSKEERGRTTIFNLTLSKKEFYDDILYGDNVEVFGIVGDNGTGKSTILDYIRRLHYDNSNFTEESGVSFSIWEENGRFVLYKGLYEEKDILLFLRDENTHTIITLTEFPYEYPRTGIVYYSDIVDEKYVYNKFDSRHSAMNWFQKQMDVSTSHYLSGKIRDFFYDEVERELVFIGDISNKEEELQNLYHIPDKIQMMINVTNFNVIEREVIKNDLSGYARDYHDISNGALQETAFITIAKFLKLEYAILNSSYRIDSQEMLSLRIEYNCIIDMLCYIKENCYGEIQAELDSIFDCVMNEIYELFPRNPKKNVFAGNLDLIRIFNSIVVEALIRNKKYEIDFWEYDNLQEKFKTFLLEYKFTLKEDGKLRQRNISIEIPTNDISYQTVVLELFERYKNISYQNWLRFSWGMSSGEKSKVTLFSRFYDVLKKVGDGDMLLLLDELDYYMHPSWQQNILSDFVMFLNKVFPNHKFQIVFTTHSPVTLSDVRKENVMFLSSKENIEETFAANIASLYWSAFSMRDGSIGAVGSNFFKKVLGALNMVKKEMNDKTTQEKQKAFLTMFYNKSLDENRMINYEREICRIRSLIENIGEDMYRVKLLERFDECNLLSEDITMEIELERLLSHYTKKQVLDYMNKK